MSAAAVPDNDRFRPAAGVSYGAPLSEERASGLVDRLAIAPGGHVLDLGCGAGSLLLRVVEAHPGTTGTGVDVDAEALAHGRVEVVRRRLQERVELVESDVRSFGDRGDVVLCVSAAGAWGSTGEALTGVRERLEPGGRALFGDRFEPDTGGAAPHALVAAAGAAGFRVESAECSTLAEWEEFAAARRAAYRATGAEDALLLASRQTRECERALRGEVGFAWLVLAPA